MPEITNEFLILNPMQESIAPMLSNDGFIRLTLQQLVNLQLHHLHSSLYAQDIATPSNSPTDIQGYTEWISETQPIISVGWDWQVQYRAGSTEYSMMGLPFSNLLLQNNQQQDFGMEESISMLAIWINTLNWQTKLFQYIQSKYA